MLLPPTGSVPNGSDLFVALTDTGVHVNARGECRWGLGVWDHPGGFLALCGWFLSQNRSIDAPGIATDEDEEDGCRPHRTLSAAPVVLWRRPPASGRQSLSRLPHSSGLRIETRFCLQFV